MLSVETGIDTQLCESETYTPIVLFREGFMKEVALKANLDR